MCGRFVITSPAAALKDLFAFADPLPNLAANYNVAPTQALLIVTREGGARRLDAARWGLVPSWAKEMGTTPLINARIETVETKPSFRTAFRRRRCLVPADGFYEWRDEGSHKQPFVMLPRTGQPFAFGGIYEHWLSPDGSDLVSVALMTGPANRYLGQIHDRSPVIILPEDYDLWLTCGESVPDAVRALLRPPPEDFFEAFPVTRAVGRVAVNGPENLRPLGPPLAPPLEDPPPLVEETPAAAPDLFSASR